MTTAVDADGMFVDGPGAERFIAPTRARLVDQKLCELDFERVASKPPWPTDSTRTPPVWTPRTAMTEAYEQWFLHMHASWPERKPRALADAELVAAATRAIQPMLAEMTKFAVYAQRRYKCPSCSALALEFAGTEFPS